MGLVVKLAPGRGLVFRLRDGREVSLVYESRRAHDARFVIFAPPEVAISKEKRFVKTWPDFCNDLGARESRGAGDYKAKNKFGFLGRYQFGLARLCDFGLTVRKPGNKGSTNDCFDWVPPNAEDTFLATPSLQDACFEVHVADLRTRVTKRFPEIGQLGGLRARDIVDPVSVSGAVGVCHLLGLGGLVQLVNGVDKADALGTRASSYLKLFNGYEIPLDLMTAADFGRRYKVKPPVASA